MSAKIKNTENNKSLQDNTSKQKVDKVAIVAEIQEKSPIKVKPPNQLEIQNEKDKRANKQNDLHSVNSNSKKSLSEEIETNKKHVFVNGKKDNKEIIQLIGNNRESSSISEHKLFSAPTSTIENFDFKTSKSETVVKYVLLKLNNFLIQFKLLDVQT